MNSFETFYVNQRDATEYVVIGSQSRVSFFQWRGIRIRVCNVFYLASSDRLPISGLEKWSGHGNCLLSRDVCVPSIK